MHILVVEDNPAAARNVELMLSGEGHNVAVTASGEEAIELAAIYMHDVVLMDLDLEDISGLEAVREMRRKKIACPVIFVSGSTDIDNKVRALAAGADDYMTKPFHKAELTARINGVQDA
jgi:two-component system cell cycle response regulator CtrA